MKKNCKADQHVLNLLVTSIHRNAKKKGFHPKESLEFWFAKQLLNNIGEIAELWEAARAGKLKHQCDKPIPLTCEEEEYADIIIRTLDQCGRLKIDIGRAIILKMMYNSTRPYKHGKRH